MSLITRMRRQKAIYWAVSGHDDYGRPAFADPVEIDCRWDDSQTEYVDSEGNKQMARSVLYPSVVMKTMDKVKLGTLESIEATSMTSAQLAPSNFEDVREVRKFDKIPNLKATEFLHIAYTV